MRRQIKNHKYVMIHCATMNDFCYTSIRQIIIDYGDSSIINTIDSYKIKYIYALYYSKFNANKIYTVYGCARLLYPNAKIFNFLDYVENTLDKMT